MVMRRNLNPDPAAALRDLMERLDQSSKNKATTPAGIVDLGSFGDVRWARENGYRSVRDIDADLDASQGRIDQALEDLAAAEIIIDEAKQEAAAAQGRLDTLETTTLPGIEADMAAQAAAVQQDFQDLDTRLDSFGDDPALAGLRDALATAQSVADNAKTAAQSANEAANAASQAALEAAGIAESKGRVIVQETEPQGEDRNAANIWIKPVPDDPDTEIEEKAVTYVYLAETDEWQPTTSSELAQAAQNALDAREAAQQAQQRADTAISNAATAQAAAEAAQTTADQATIDAADAHNAAAEAAESAQAAIERGESILINGSFELGTLNWPTYIGDNTHERAGILQDPGARTGSHVLRLSPTTNNIYPETDLIAVEPGQVLHVRGWFKHLGGDGQQVRLLVREHDADQAYTAISYAYEQMDVQSWPLDTWILAEGDFTVPEGTRWLRFAFHVTGPSTSTYHCDDLQVTDVTAARDAAAAAEEARQLAESKPDMEDVETAILTSANGKNTITLSTEEPSSATPGVVTGDTWWQVDGAGDIFGQWIWNGSNWGIRKIRSEVIANLDVNKLQVIGDAVMAQAVIDKLWVDGLVAKTAAFNQVSIAPGNIVPDPSGMDPAIRTKLGGGSWTWDDTGRYWTRPAVQGGTTQFNLFIETSGYSAVPITPGAVYAFEYDAWVDKVGASTGGRVAIYYRRADGTTAFVGDDAEGATGDSDSADPLVAGQWNHVTRVWRAPDDAYSGGFAAQILWGASDATEVRIKNPFVGKQAGAILIGNGAISTPHLNVTESMAAKMADFMSVATKELIVTGGATLANSKLIGETWAESLTVTDKIIGTDGIFTGTVDFANVNVTGDLLAAQISGETISGVTVTGASLRTEIVDGTYVELAHDVRWSRPGLAFRMPGFSEPGSITARTPVNDPDRQDLQGRMVMSSGYDGTGHVSHVVAGKNKAFMEAGDSFVTVAAGAARMQSKASSNINDGALAYIEARDNESIMSYRTTVSGTDGYIRQRALVADAESVKLKAWANLSSDGSPVWYRQYDMFGLFEPAWISLTGWSGFEEATSGAPFQCTKVGNRVYMRGRIQRTSGNFQVGTAYTVTRMSSGWRPEYTERQLVGHGSASGVSRVEISASTGDVSVSPITGDASWIDFAGLWFDLPLTT